jgi:hypothetical protein
MDRAHGHPEGSVVTEHASNPAFAERTSTGRPSRSHRRSSDFPQSDDPSSRAPGPLSADNLTQLDIAKKRAKKIRRAAKVAVFGGWSTGIFAALSLIFGIFSMTSLLLGIAFSIVTFNEFVGARMLRRLDRRAPMRLCLNQVFFCSVLIAYSVWSIYRTLNNPNPLTSQLAESGAMMDALGPIAEMETTLMLVIYGAIIPLSLIFQGGTAWYHFTRRKHLLAYIQKTPAWIVELQKRSSLL